jgi:hypothetical protein
VDCPVKINNIVSLFYKNINMQEEVLITTTELEINPIRNEGIIKDTARVVEMELAAQEFFKSKGIKFREPLVYYDEAKCKWDIIRRQKPL